MKFFLILSAFVAGCVVQATPLSTAIGADGPVLTKTSFSAPIDSVLSTAIANHGLHNLVDKTAIHTAEVSPVPATSLEKRQVILPVIVFCPAFNCDGDCEAFSLLGDPLNTCFPPAPNPFFSVFISNPFTELLFQVGVTSNTFCSGLSILPVTNACFNISPFGQSWALLNTGVTF